MPSEVLGSDAVVFFILPAVIQGLTGFFFYKQSLAVSLLPPSPLAFPVPAIVDALTGISSL